jgi:hypothetical protein
MSQHPLRFIHRRFFKPRLRRLRLVPVGTLLIAGLLFRDLSKAEEAFARQSPCLIETAFPLGDASKWNRVKSMEHFEPGKALGLAAWPTVLGKETSIPEWYALGRYTCDGVSLREEVKKHGAEWEEPGLRISELRHLPNGNYEVTLEATLYNPKGNGDRLVTLVYEILDNAKAVIQTAERTYKLDAKAKSGENADAILLVTPADMPRVAALRLTITTKAY